MNICIYDATETSAVGISWKIGARLYKAIGRFDAIHGATSWVDAWDWLARITLERNITSLQFWGHGSCGAAYIGGEKITYPVFLPTRLNPSSLIWFRTCNTAAGECGHRFMLLWASMGCKVAAHTRIIGFWQSGLQTLSPGEKPGWSVGAGGDSSRDLPRTIPFWANSFPKEW